MTQKSFDKSQAVKRFYGQVVIVTGASKGIGREIADLLLKKSKIGSGNLSVGFSRSLKNGKKSLELFQSKLPCEVPLF